MGDTMCSIRLSVSCAHPMWSGHHPEQLLDACVAIDVSSVSTATAAKLEPSFARGMLHLEVLPKKGSAAAQRFQVPSLLYSCAQVSALGATPCPHCHAQRDGEPHGAPQGGSHAHVKLPGVAQVEALLSCLHWASTTALAVDVDSFRARAAANERLLLASQGHNRVGDAVMMALTAFGRGHREEGGGGAYPTSPVFLLQGFNRTQRKHHVRTMTLADLVASTNPQLRVIGERYAAKTEQQQQGVTASSSAVEVAT